MSGCTDSNRGLPAPKAGALDQTELHPVTYIGRENRETRHIANTNHNISPVHTLFIYYTKFMPNCQEN